MSIPTHSISCSSQGKNIFMGTHHSPSNTQQTWKAAGNGFEPSMETTVPAPSWYTRVTLHGSERGWDDFRTKVRPLVCSYKWARNYPKPEVAISLLVWVTRQAECSDWVCSPDLWLSVLKTNHFTSVPQQWSGASYAWHFCCVFSDYQGKGQFMMDIALMVCLQSAVYVYDAIKRQRNTRLNTTYFVCKTFAMGKHCIR